MPQKAQNAYGSETAASRASMASLSGRHWTVPGAITDGDGRDVVGVGVALTQLHAFDTAAGFMLVKGELPRLPG